MNAAEITLEGLIEQIAKIKELGKPGQVEVAVRNAKGQIENIFKLMLKNALPEQAKDIAKAAAQVAQKGANALNAHDFDLGIFQDKLLKEITPAEVRKVLAQLGNGQKHNLALLESMAPQVEQIFEKTTSTAVASWLGVALSAADLIASIAGTVIICQKLDSIGIKLDKIAEKVDSIKRVQFKTHVTKPCNDLIVDYKQISSDIKKGKKVPEGTLVELIKGCRSHIKYALDMRSEYSLGAILEVVYALLPVFTNSICLYYQNFFDGSDHSLHDDWMDLFRTLETQSLLNEIEDYLFLEEGEPTKQVHDYLDCQALVLIGLRKKITDTLEDIKKCDGDEGYRRAMQLSQQCAAQMAKSMEAELTNRYGAQEASLIVEPVKKRYMYT